MSYRVYACDANGRYLTKGPLKISGDYDGEIYDTRRDAHRFIARLRIEESATKLTPERELELLRAFWLHGDRGQIDVRDRVALDLDRLSEIVDGPEFGYLKFEYL